MNLKERLKRVASRLKEKGFSVEIIFYKENENIQEVLKQREAELNKKIDIPIYIKIIPNN